MPEEPSTSEELHPTPQSSSVDADEPSIERLGPQSAGARYASGKIASPDVILSRKNVFDALDELFKDTGIKRGSKEALKWYKELLREMFDLSDVSPEETFLRDQSRMVQKSGMLRRTGRMFLFNYKPKTRSTIKYYDSLPLVYVIKFTKDGFLGLNLHYLDIQQRTRLFTALQVLLSGDIENDMTRLRINYQILKGARKFRYYRPCIRKYKTRFIGSRVLLIPPKDWGIAIHLPVERFIKKTKYQVWVESRRMLLEEHEGVAAQ